jgi:hypothetical protein
MISDRSLGPLYAQNQVIETCSVQPLQSSCSVVAISEVNEGKALLQCQISGALLLQVENSLEIQLTFDRP